jgi:hypothetical protein
MGCGCGKNRKAQGIGLMPFEVWKDGVFTGRAFTSLVNARTYAERVSGEVRSNA